MYQHWLLNCLDDLKDIVLQKSEPASRANCEVGMLQHLIYVKCRPSNMKISTQMEICIQNNQHF